jgi:hypothetical protein
MGPPGMATDLPGGERPGDCWLPPVYFTWKVAVLVAPPARETTSL